MGHPLEFWTQSVIHLKGEKKENNACRQPIVCSLFPTNSPTTNEKSKGYSGQFLSAKPPLVKVLNYSLIKFHGNKE